MAIQLITYFFYLELRNDLKAVMDDIAVALADVHSAQEAEVAVPAAPDGNSTRMAALREGRQLSTLWHSNDVLWCLTLCRMARICHRRCRGTRLASLGRGMVQLNLCTS